MSTITRGMQLVGLTLPLVAIVMELNDAISLGQMLMFLVASICLFSIGYLVQQYTGGG